MAKKKSNLTKDLEVLRFRLALVEKIVFSAVGVILLAVLGSLLVGVGLDGL